MASFIIVSHSKKIAEGVKELVGEMNPGQAMIKAVGGTEDGRIGTNSFAIKQAIEEVSNDANIFVLMDLGSSIMATQMAMDLLDKSIEEKVILIDAPIVEGAIAAIIQASITSNVEEIVHAAREAKTMNKF
ncbi:dihydroxyacetone kinase phosphoryl donor subunit DhaM [Irregularibacter muris]|uniref:phosphoenolpyruvate--glycerone phosphotransferase n=1 Tax=Irregularibacter muris TaxID=1796619 RepID=A0AAE3L0Q1_9FIRM|nr:dihydroxyacetone kinase phosphoryl donor subunit DhaM [Irregularibacter muris]MCR1900302.1 dihydroxyacetone kinase phosphoryl donor subunit DhaM [Irregularibacter muris]